MAINYDILRQTYGWSKDSPSWSYLFETFGWQKAIERWRELHNYRGAVRVPAAMWDGDRWREFHQHVLRTEFDQLPRIPARDAHFVTPTGGLIFPSAFGTWDLAPIDPHEFLPIRFTWLLHRTEALIEAKTVEFRELKIRLKEIAATAGYEVADADVVKLKQLKVDVGRLRRDAAVLVKLVDRETPSAIKKRRVVESEAEFDDSRYLEIQGLEI